MGWEAHLVAADDGQGDVLFYCRLCAEREFHRIDGATDSDPEPT